MLLMRVLLSFSATPRFVSYPPTILRTDAGKIGTLLEQRTKLVVSDGIDGSLEGFMTLT
jgi:hypothetical protein